MGLGGAQNPHYPLSTPDAVGLQTIWKCSPHFVTFKYAAKVNGISSKVYSPVDFRHKVSSQELITPQAESYISSTSPADGYTREQIFALVQLSNTVHQQGLYLWIVQSYSDCI